MIFILVPPIFQRRKARARTMLSMRMRHKKPLIGTTPMYASFRGPYDVTEAV